MTKRSSSRRARRANRLTRPLSLTHLEVRLNPAGPMLPNLQVYQPDMPSGTITVNASHEIRFTTSLANLGVGAFDLRGTGPIITAPDGTQTRVTYQRIYNDDNNNGYYDAPGDTTFTDQIAGEFVYHAAHGHMHFNEFAIARLRIRPTDQSVGPIVAVGPKTSFCLIDLGRPYPTLPGSPTTAQYSCDASHEGISVGWKDIYNSGLDGQYINVTNIPNGDYWLEIECDYANHVQELNETDNVSRTAITITNQPITTGFMVLSSTPSGAQQLPVDHIDFQFNQEVKPGTFTTSAVTFAGPPGQSPIAVTSVESLSSVLYRVNFATQSAIGTYQMTLDATQIKSLNGNAMLDQNNNGTGGEAGDGYTHIFAITSPYIVTAVPAGTTSAPVSKVTLNYDRPMVSSTFTTADIVSFTGPGGVNLLPTITGVTPVTSGGQSTAFDIAFTAVSTAGTYTLVVGPGIQDSTGNFVDQNQNGTPNETADQYTNIFTIPVAGTYGPDAFGYTATSTAFQTITMTGATGITYTNTDDESKAMDISTDKFNFYGTTYTGTTLFASTNGLITFGSGNTAYNNNNGLASLTQPAIGVMWDDWIIGSGTPQVRYLRRDNNSDSINDELVVEWNQVRHYQTTTGGITFQAILELNTGSRPGKITLNYPDLVQGDTSYDKGAAATVGLRSNSTMNSTLTVSANSNSHPLIGDGKAMLLSVPSVVSITREDTSPAPDGDVHFLVTFSDAVTGVDAADFAVTTTSGITGAMIHDVEATGVPNIWELHVESGVGSGTLGINLIDNDTVISAAGAKLGGTGLVNGDFKTGESYTINQRAPQIAQLTYNDGSVQRSRIYQIEVTFDHPVQFLTTGAAAFQIIGAGGPVTLSVDTGSSTEEQTVAILTFSGSQTEFNSLKDGAYTLTVLANQISTGGVALDGDANTVPGDNFVASFNRLFGDYDGDGVTGLNDFAAFQNAFNVGANTAFDFNNDGNVGLSDFAAFRARFNLGP